MANALVADEVLRVVVACESQGQYALNVSHWQTVSIGTPAATDADAAKSLAGTFQSLHKPIMAATANFYGVSVQKYYPIRYDPAPDTSEAGAGAGEQDLIPTQVAGLISLRTGLAGRRFRGRKYIAFPPEEYNNASGDPSLDYRGALQGIAAVYSTPHNITQGGRTATIHCIAWDEDVPLVKTKFLSYIVRTHWATQKRRGELTRGDAAPF